MSTLLTSLNATQPGNRTPEADEIAQCAPYLERQIQLIQPKLIVALGETAALLLGHDATLSDLRGKLHDYRGSSSPGLVKGIPLVITYHPANLLHTPLKKPKHGTICAWQLLQCSGWFEIIGLD